MADVVRQIRHDLEQLEKAVSALGEEFDQVYDNYLAALRTSVQKQVVLACYHLCTQNYPERFLELSFRQRETLQQAIQRYIHELQQKLEHAYVLATNSLVKEDDDDIMSRTSRRRSLPAAERSLRQRSRGEGRDRKEDRRDRNDSPDQDGPSIEFIAITNIDGDEALEASKDPFLAAALSEFADSLALDEEAILKRVKQELLRKATQSPSKSIEGSRTEDDTDDIDETSDDHPLQDESPQHDSPRETETADDTPVSELNASEPADSDYRSEVSAIALSNNPKTSGSEPDQVPFPDNPDGKHFSDCDETLTPDILAARQEQLEENLAGFLRDLSKQINHQLHQVGMIPKKIPGAVLKAALQTDMSSEFNGTPNVLNLLVEAEGKSKDSKVMRVTALRLRPPELEFSDPQLSACRSRIRELTGKLQKLGKQYHKKQRERAIAEAESAWRSSWYEPKD